MLTLGKFLIFFLHLHPKLTSLEYRQVIFYTVFLLEVHHRLIDVKLLKNIISNADVFIQNLWPGFLKKVGLDSSTLRKKYQSLITCYISGFGETGPYSKLKAYDLLVQAETALCSLTGTPDAPGRVGVSVCDIACGMNAYSLILEALIKKEFSGKGSAIKISLFERL